jgi:hypothetical protein
LITLMTLGEKDKLQSSSLCSFLLPSATSSLYGQITLTIQHNSKIKHLPEYYVQTAWSCDPLVSNHTPEERETSNDIPYCSLWAIKWVALFTSVFTPFVSWRWGEIHYDSLHKMSNKHVH